MKKVILTKFTNKSTVSLNPNFCEFSQNDFISKTKQTKKSKYREFAVKLRFLVFWLFSNTFWIYSTDLRLVEVDEPSMTVGIDLRIIKKKRFVCQNYRITLRENACLLSGKPSSKVAHTHVEAYPPISPLQRGNILKVARFMRTKRV